MIDSREFMMHARIDAAALEAWIGAGWLAPQRETETDFFSDIDVARAQLIRDLREDMGVNDEGVGVVLDLVDQLHGIRHTLRCVLLSIHRQPEPVRTQLCQDVREAASKLGGDAPARMPGAG